MKLVQNQFQTMGLDVWRPRLVETDTLDGMNESFDKGQHVMLAMGTQTFWVQILDAIDKKNKYLGLACSRMHQQSFGKLLTFHKKHILAAAAAS